MYLLLFFACHFSITIFIINNIVEWRLMRMLLAVSQNQPTLQFFPPSIHPFFYATTTKLLSLILLFSTLCWWWWWWCWGNWERITSAMPRRWRTAQKSVNSRWKRICVCECHRVRKGNFFGFIVSFLCSLMQHDVTSTMYTLRARRPKRENSNFMN